MSTDDPAMSANPLESFVRDYVETAGGLWEQVEPQVYDVLSPAAIGDGETPGDGDAMQRICFDPEAVPEHPGSQFCTLGTPLIDRFLADAKTRGRFAWAWVNVVNVQPFDLERRVQRALRLPSDGRLILEPPRVVDVIIDVFWFAAEYDSDQKEQDLLRIAIERQGGREVRHLDQLLAAEVLDQAPLQEHPPGPAIPRVQAFDTARRQVLRTVIAAAGRRQRGLHERLDRQRRRIERYYDDLLAEIDQTQARADRRGHDASKHETRRQHARQERRVRLAELDRAAGLDVTLSLTSVLEVHQPKVRLGGILTARGARIAELPLCYDPLTESLEPPDCPACRHPSFAIELPKSPRPGTPRWLCPNCLHA